MRNYIILNGVNSNTISGLLISTLPSISKPKQRATVEEIDGRDGDIVTKLGYSAYEKEFEIGLYGDFDINEVISYFNSEGTVVFSNEADKYYNYQILDQIDYEKLIRFKTAKVKMHVQPFKYPLQEEQIQVDATVVQASGTDIKLEYTTLNASIETEVEGKSEQEGTPTPDTPQEIKSVSGIYNEFFVSETTGTSNGVDYNISKNKLILNGTCSSDRIIIPINMSLNGTYAFSTKNWIKSVALQNSSSQNLLITTSNIGYIVGTANGTATKLVLYGLSGVSFDNTEIDLQLEQNSTPHTPVPYGHWLPVKVSNRNLFSSNMELGSLNNSNGATSANNDCIRTADFIPINSNTQYTISNDKNYHQYIYYYDENKAFISYISNQRNPYTFTTLENAKYIKIRTTVGTIQNDLTTKFQLEEGSTATDYIEHQEQTTLIDLNKYDENNNIVGNYELCSTKDESIKDLLIIKDGKAVLNKNINNIMFNGTENWNKDANVDNDVDYFYISNVGINRNNVNRVISNYFTKGTNNIEGFWATTAFCITINKIYTGITSSDTKDQRIDKFKSWLSTHNTELYYALETPEEIELNGDYNIKAYDQVTYMTTEGNLIPVINAKTSGMPNTIVTNIGNIYAKPLMTIYGSGDIGVYLNNQHVLQIALGDNESITIDVSKMEAYDKNTKVLMNRLVTGDYMKFLINSGENEIAFSGTVAGFTMDNYTRWL